MALTLIFSALIEFPRMIARKAWKELSVFSVLTILGLILIFLISFSNYDVPFIGSSIARLIQGMFPFIKHVGQ